MHFKKCRFSVWTVKWNTTSDLWTYTCPPWMKQKVCKHKVALQVLVGKHVFRLNASDIKIGEKRKQGQPRDIPIKQALVKDSCVPMDNYLALSLRQPQEMRPATPIQEEPFDEEQLPQKFTHDLPTSEMEFGSAAPFHDMLHGWNPEFCTGFL